MENRSKAQHIESHKYQVPLNSTDDSEVVAYESTEYPIYISHGLLSEYLDYSAVSHWHEDLEFIVINSGHMTYNVDGTLVELKAGDGIMVNSRHFHYGFDKKKRECDFLCVLIHPLLFSVNPSFDTKYLTPVISNPNHPYIYLSKSFSWQKDFMTQIQKICKAKGKEDFPIQMQPMVSKILSLLYSNMDQENLIPARDEKQLSEIKAMVTYIQHNYSEALTLESIAQAANVSTSSCTKLFKKYIQKSPIAYLTTIRLSKSATLLTETSLTISEIGYETGFSSARYFTETFRKYYGCTPKEYRANLQ